MNIEHFTLLEALEPYRSAKAQSTGTGEVIVVHDEFGHSSESGVAGFAIHDVVIDMAHRVVAIEQTRT